MSGYSYTAEYHRLAQRKWRAKNPERARAINRKHALKRRTDEHYKEYRRTYNRKWRAANPDKVRAAGRKHWRNRFGAVRPCPLMCECCGKTNRALQMDHDHLLGTFRGWICSGCNTSIGKLGDDIAGVQRALDYLQRNNSL